ncbi:MAG: SMI1/KNR4 family protein [Oscillospiraceae bacterium]|nr:SMI1/KNR4 family protein [Oscillospiraceae bacterium]
MKLTDIETKFEVKFPKKWHEIYETGAMEWMETENSEFIKNVHKYTDDPKAFFMLDCDCEPLSVWDIEERAGELKEWISWRCEDEGESFDESVKLVPFAMTGAGDLYCFMYKPDADEPEVILYLHDEYDDPDIIGRDFDEFLYVMMLNAVSWDEDIDGEHWQAHLEYLSDEYRSKLEGKSSEELSEEYDEMVFVKTELFN